MSTNAKTSILINSQVPGFVRADYQTFVTFMQAYYEYLEQSNNTVAYGKTTERLKNILNYQDVDKTLADFSDRLYEHFLQLIPRTTPADRDIIIKNVKDFYRARGTEKALKFLLRILIGQEATVYYPKRDILRWSDGKWYIQKSLRITSTAVDGVSNSSYAALSAWRSTRLTGNTSNATAVVEKVDRFAEGGTQIDELILSSIHGTFADGESIRANFKEAETSRFISANVFAGIINTLSIDNAGLGYNVGDYLTFTGGSGHNANAVISRVTQGNITSLLVLSGGAGFRANDFVIFTGGGGSGANAKVLAANTDATVHPNSYNLCITLIRDLAGTLMNTANYPNMNYSIVSSPNAATRMIDGLRFFTLSNIGPIINVVVLSSGSGYTDAPSIGAAANTKLVELGILGRLRIVNGGLGYNRGDKINFFNVPHGSGCAAKGNVTANAANGMITQVKFEANTIYEPIGGWGYDKGHLPRANVISATGTGANVVVDSLLGDGDTYQLGSGSLGAILEITLTNRGDGYLTAPNVDLSLQGDGNAQVSVEIIRGAFTYPGRYLNDDGHLSSYNFLQNRDYYQNYSYVVRIAESLAFYRKAVLDILHPAGLRLFGEYLLEPEEINVASQLLEVNGPTVLRANITYSGNAANFAGANMPYRDMIANTGLRANGDLVIALSAEFNNSLVNIANVFVNNVQATRLVYEISKDTFSEHAAIYAIRNVANTNAYINVVTTMPGMGNVAISTYRVLTANVLNVYTANVKTSNVTPQTMSLLGLRIEGNGSALISSCFNDETRTATWFGATQQDDVGIGTGGVRHTTATSLNVGASGTNTNVTVTMSAAATRQAMVGVSWIIGA